ncbi:MAG: hypothetical protein LBV46_00260 [Bacteroidales bacterium]|jgi:hypothetical protein|nr:hypothetical protein [Bacteroidales bacterium]
MMMARYIGNFLLVFSCLFLGQCHAIKPPGTTKVKIDQEVVYLDKVNISNFEWCVYVWHRQSVDSVDLKTYRSLLPDSILWMQRYGQSLPVKERGQSMQDIFSKIFFQQKEIKDEPVVGISPNQAEGYCKWRTTMVNYRFEKKFKTDKRVDYTLLSDEQCLILSKMSKWRNVHLASRNNTVNGFRCIAIMK